jgi:predicted transcriptional regulator
MNDHPGMDAEATALFLSLRPRFAEMLLDGRKTVELRRVRPTADEGSIVLLYASSPERTLVGRAEIAEIQVDSLDTIWRQHSRATGLTRDEYDAYFGGVDQAVAITLRSIRRLAQPRPLDELRRRLVGFRPPQSFRYLDSFQVASLI